MAKYYNDEEVHVVPLIAPVDTAAVAVNTDVVNLENYHNVQFIIPLGVVTGDTIAATVEECDDTTPSNSTAIAFYYRLSSAVGTDSMGARAVATTAGVTVAATDDNKVLIIDVASDELTDGFPYVRAVLTPGGSMTVLLVGAVAIMRPRYPQAVQVSAVE
ncbi:MAG: hypothetical protein HN368_13640 [Spirochaetales bacterium]|jgi:hypothetical protein|nr:hypothetical protein [Spirochaetales bacterium]